MNVINTFSDPNAPLYAHVQSNQFLENIRTGVVIVDADGTVIDCNKAAAAMVGVSTEELKGQSAFSGSAGAVREDGTPLPAEEFPASLALQVGEPRYGVIVGISRSGHPQRWLSADAYPVVVDGQVKGAVVWFDDITTELKNRRLLQLNAVISRNVALALDADPLQRLCDTLVSSGAYKLAWIGRPSLDQEGDIDVAFSAGATGYPFDGMVSSLESKDAGRGPVGTAFRTGAIQVVNDLPKESLFEPWRKRALEFRLGSCIAIPFSPGGHDSVLAIYDRHTHTFDETTVQGLESIAKQSEIGIAQAQSVTSLAEALDGTLAALGQITETRDPYTAGHQLNVGTLGVSLAEAIAAEYGLDPTMIKLIRQSGEVHDIGKICIPSEILTRPGRLSPLEYEMVKRHTVVGFEILSKASLPWPIAEVALQHHERLNGSGYPNGLSEGEIILPALIVAVADVVEAMTQHRPYRPGLGVERALGEVTAGAGTLFDAKVVNACLAVFESGFTFTQPSPRGSDR